MNRQGILIVGLLFVLFLVIRVEPLCAQSLWDGTVSRPPGRKVEQDYTLFKNIGEQFSHQSHWLRTVLIIIFLLFLVVLTCGLIIFDLHLRQRNKTVIDNPRYLFTELARAHELTWIERQFLVKFAKELKLQDPLPLFIEPQYFLSALEDNQFRDSHPMIDYFRKKLFEGAYGGFAEAEKTSEKTPSGVTTIISVQGKHDKR